jgi:hypothetical protein
VNAASSLLRRIRQLTVISDFGTVAEEAAAPSFRPFWRCRSLRLVLPAYDFFDRAIAR